MASILIKFGLDENGTSDIVAKKIMGHLKQVGLENRVGSSGPLRHTLTNEITLTVWVHEDKADEFRAALSQLFYSDKDCSSVRDLTDGLTKS